MDLRDLDHDERLRYARQLVLPELGEHGQCRLKAGSVLLVGAGGLGAPAALYLAAAGVGRIGLIDDDRVDRSNLQRQVLFDERDLDRPKVEAGAERLRALNPQITIETHWERLSAANVIERIGAYELVLDGTDNFASRWLIGDACALRSRPLIQGSVLRFQGQVALFDPPRGPCHRCLFERPPDAASAPSCAEAGVLGVLPGIVGSLMALEAIKLLAGIGTSLSGRLLQIDALSLQVRSFTLARDPACRLCSSGRTIHQPEEFDAMCPPAAEEPLPDLTCDALQARLQAGDRPVLLDVREAHEWGQGHLAEAIWIPVRQLASRLGELDRTRETVVYCAAGARSAWAVNLLRQHGFTGARNLLGGISSWNGAVVQSGQPSGR